MKTFISIFIFFLLFFKIGFGQDPMFIESRQILSFLNPALTGLNGSLTIRTTMKDQYWKASNKGLLSGGINIEQSWPCKKIDVGIYNISDREGDGLLTSNFLGGNFVYTLPVKLFGAHHNFRIGTKMDWIHKYVNWNKFYFSDQIDSKYNLTDAYGVPNTSAFQPPEWESTSQLTLGLGVIHKAEIGVVNPWSLTWGFSFDNSTNIFEDKYYDSILNLEKEKKFTFTKFSLYFAPEFRLKKYLEIKPTYIFQKHFNLVNQQIGFDVNYGNLITGGFYLLLSDFKNYRSDTKAINISSFVRVITTKRSQLNLGIQYVHNIGGLSEVFGQTIQLSLRYNFKKDGCASPTSTSDCPNISIKDAILYQDIWLVPPWYY